MINWDMFLYLAVVYISLIIPIAIIIYGITMLSPLIFSDFYGWFVIGSGIYWLGAIVILFVEG